MVIRSGVLCVGIVTLLVTLVPVWGYGAPADCYRSNSLARADRAMPVRQCRTSELSVTRTGTAAHLFDSSSLAAVHESRTQTSLGGILGLVSPSAGSYVYGDVVVSASVIPSGCSVGRVSFYVRPAGSASFNQIGVDYVYPYEVVWKTDTLSEGTYTLKSEMQCGGLVSSSPIDVNINHTPRWEVTGALSYDAADHQATLLSDGRVLVSGGWKARSEIYDPVLRTWSTTRPMAVIRGGHTATLMPNGKVLVVGGDIYHRSNLETPEVYDPDTNTWNETASLLGGARYGHTATLLRTGKVLVAGGQPNGGNMSALYDPENETWGEIATMNSSYLNHTATLLEDGRVLVAGGGSAELYDPDSNTWSAINPMTRARWGHTATLLPGGDVLVTGGEGLVSNLATTAEIYEKNLGTWHAVGSMSTVRDTVTGLLVRGSNYTATLLPNGKVLAPNAQ